MFGIGFTRKYKERIDNLEKHIDTLENREVEYHLKIEELRKHNAEVWNQYAILEEQSRFRQLEADNVIAEKNNSITRLLTIMEMHQALIEHYCPRHEREKLRGLVNRLQGMNGVMQEHLPLPEVEEQEVTQEELKELFSQKVPVPVPQAEVEKDIGPDGFDSEGNYHPEYFEPKTLGEILERARRVKELASKESSKSSKSGKSDESGEREE